VSKIWAIVFLFIILIQYSSAQSGLYSDLYKYVKSSVVVVQANDSTNEPICQGTGFFIDQAGYIITNFHIINGSSKVNVTTADGHSYPIKNVLAKDISSDLACLSVDIPPQLVYPIRVNTTPPEVGEEVLVIGYPEGPGGLVQSMTRGIVSSVQTLNEYGEVIQVDAAVSRGASGSPLVNMKCEAIGVTTFGYIKGQNQNFAVSCMQVSNLIHDISSAQGGKPISEWNLTSEEKLYALGLDLYRKGEYNQSIYYFEEAIKLDPNYADAWYKKGNDLSNLGRYYDALQAYNKTIELNPQNTFAWIDKGIILKLMNKHGESFQAYDKAVELNPQNEFLWVSKGEDLAAQGKYDEAILAYDKAIELKPQGLQGAIVWSVKGDALKAQGKYEEALLAYNKSIELDTHLGNTRMSKNIVLKALGRSPEGKAAVP
jgi:Flp pilus assembly protein TadD